MSQEEEARVIVARDKRRSSLTPSIHMLHFVSRVTELQNKCSSGFAITNLQDKLLAAVERGTMGPPAKEYPKQYFAASALASGLGYPFWRAAAIGQSGFKMNSIHVGGVKVPPVVTPYVYGFLPPYKGMVATVFGMTWARACIFWMSDYGHDVLLKQGYSQTVATVAPPLAVSAMVQVMNQPIVRSTVTLQDPKYNLPNVVSSIRQIYNSHGITGLWHGTTAGILKTVPKYVTAIAIKDIMEENLPQADPNSPTYDSDRFYRSVTKSATAGVAGAALTNPLDVIRNEQFKTHSGIRLTVQSLWNEMGLSFLTRGLGKNMVAVAMPVGMTIFFTDMWCSPFHSFDSNGWGFKILATEVDVMASQQRTSMCSFIFPPFTSETAAVVWFASIEAITEKMAVKVML
eukprot:scaffold1034_cov127-Cylindrotheca_fusiformis.AAC.18